LKAPGRRGVIFILVGILIVALGAAAIFYVVRQVDQPVAPALISTPVTEKVLVTARGIVAGSVLGPDDLTYQDVPVNLVPLNRLTDKTVAIGKITNQSMVAGEMVLPHHLSESTNIIDRTMAFTIGDDQVLMAFPINDLMGSLNILKRGDLVDVLVSISSASKITSDVSTQNQEAEPQLFTFDAMQRVTISAVVQDVVAAEEPIPTPGAGTPQPPPQPARTASKPVALMLALNPQDALTLKYLKDAGATFDVVLRAPNSTQLFDTTPVNPQYVIEKYELQTPR
jgi:Flp pilus assembly protein CpaB